jgi:protein SCO1/2
MKQDQDHSQQQSTDRAGRIRGSHVLAGGVALAVLIAATIGVLSLRGGETEETYVFSSILVDPPEDAPALGLVTQHGDSFDADVLRGEVTLVYFGYTHCPDVCPTTLAGFGSAIAQLPADQRDEVQVVMVTVDPERDTPERLATYLANFNDDYIGLTGDDSALARVAEDWRIRVEYGPTLEDGSYFVGHPAFSLVLDRDMRKRLMVPSQMTATQLALDLAQLLEE